MSKYYLAGPMTGIPQHNVPLFESAAKELRCEHSLDVVTPLELDGNAYRKAAMADKTGTAKFDARTWGDFLARDVKLIADEVDGIVFLPNWEKSRGARLEAFVGILCGVSFLRYVPGEGLFSMSRISVLAQLDHVTYEELKNASI